MCTAESHVSPYCQREEVERVKCNQKRFLFLFLFTCCTVPWGFFYLHVGLPGSFQHVNDRLIDFLMSRHAHGALSPRVFHKTTRKHKLHRIHYISFHHEFTNYSAAPSQAKCCAFSSELNKENLL